MARLIQEQLVEDYLSKNFFPYKAQQELLLSNRWQCRDDIGDDGEWVEDLTSIFEGLDPSIVLALKLALLNDGALRISENCVLSKKSTFVGLLMDYRWLSRELRLFEVNRLSELDKIQVHSLYSSMLKRSPVSPGSSGRIDTPICRQSVERRAKLIQRIGANYRHGLSLDGFVTTLSEPQYLALVEPTVKLHMEWKEWLKGGSLGGFPLELSLSLLVHSASIIQSNEARFILALQDAFKEHVLQARPKISFKKRGDIFISCLRKFKLFNLQNDKITNNKYQKSRFKFHRSTYDAYFVRGGNIDNIDPGIVRSVGDYNKIRNSVAYSCLSIILITSGIRLSELKSLTRDSFKVDENGNVSFISKMVKTNHSIGTERPITGLALDAYNVLNDLNLKSDPSQGDPLFHIESISNRLVTVSMKGDGGYKNWIIETFKTLLADYRPEDHPSISAHRFRHTWAELALRRFDGNVHEAVRNPFRHAVGSWMTMEYLKEKYHEDFETISKEYMRELIGRAASGKEEFFGPVGRFILKQLSEISPVSPEDIDRLIDEFEIVDPHEYGYCMIRKSQRVQAKCFDKASQSPKYDQAKFELCGGCIGSLRFGIHKDAITRIGMAAQEHARVFGEMGYASVTALSKKTIKLCESAIKEFDSRMPLQ